ncbi:bifunctional aminoglycoside phosphotransferase/ATP-binding protein [Burkholderia sp. LA-2-3-30-S1-D2]|uniref:bifunctional aminoglycoside phosphotransferase/ATP-binding protein n=1 Tax=Burkholderia sp. LA-2-3-30-S1-D2 TaxID=1637862 RepID=UPI0007545839|nr:bifunctional aminoglycoside phosphotransferase/ATP-binding protein [Burkholderia sp. LA-2-3-30-S1-D2]AOJ00334.1 kinase [Burkholderia sp. LA-2-3-30-S1-D2]KVE15568.1 kinase [Burkholderia sp. LA-2-3-30-S1-D2]
MPRSPHVPFALSRGDARRKSTQFDRAMRRPATYPHPAGRIERIETHLSVVYLAGRYAYKRIKPVHFAFVDLMRPALRRRCALAECTLNRPFAGPLYLGVWPLVSHGRRCAFAAPVPTGGRRRRRQQQTVPGEYVVRMRRFDARAMLSVRSASHDDGLADADALADTLARHHLHASRRAPRGRAGSAASVAAQCRPLLDTLDITVPDEAALRAWYEAELTRIAPLLADRHALGFVRACHGDLHLDNIVCWRNRILMFDCIEFDDTLRWIDVASDLAFALMDFSAHGRADCAHRLLSGWLARTGDHAALGVLPCYFVYRALVRALTARLRGDEAARAGYLRIASAMADARREAQPVLLLCHGVSGSGKSLASRALAAQLGAIRLSSDVERKRLAGASTDTRLSPGAYSDTAIDEIYERLLSEARVVLDSGYTAIVDATFLRQHNRSAFVALAARLGVRVAMLDFTASPATLTARVAARAARGHDASDADTAVLARQIGHADPLTEAEAAIAIRFDTDCDAAAYESRAFWAPLLATLRT